MNPEVFAKVGEKDITREDLENVLRSMPPEHAQQLSQAGIEAMVEEAVRQELFYQEGLAEKVEELDAFKKEMELIRKNLVRGFAVNMEMEKARPTEAEMKKYYEEYKEGFTNPRQVKASHILVETLEEAEQAQKELANQSFEDVAKLLSTCPSKERGGDLGYFSRGQMVPEFEEVAFSLDKGVVSEPVKTQFGYHLIKVEDIKETSFQTYGEAKGNIERILSHEKQQKAYSDFVERLKEKYTVEYPVQKA